MKRILVCNQKMYLTGDEAAELEKNMRTLDVSKLELIVCPSHINYDVFKGYDLGSQDAFYEDKGAYTGEVSAYDLSLRGIKYSLVGHSERRCYDDDRIINLKLKAILRNSMRPILCVGETKMDNDLRRTPEVIKSQLKKALKDVFLEAGQSVYVAYEPRYLIGGKTTLSKAEIIDRIKYIRKILKEENVKSYKLLYGGAITSRNIKEIVSNEVDGYLLGASCTDFEELKKIIECIK
jgi:triosephosphate isomerase